MAKKVEEVEFEVLPPEAGEPRSELMRIFAWLLDDLFRVPGTKFRFGFDPIIGLFPGLGDGSTAVVSSVMLVNAARAGVPRIVLARMALNILINSLGGVIPVAGDIFSAWFKSNRRNYDLLLKHSGRRGQSTRGDWIFVAALVGAVLCIAISLAIGLAFVSMKILGTLWAAIAG